MCKNIKVHIFYLIIILLIITATIILNFSNIVYWILDVNQEGYLKINTNVELINPKNGEVVGYLKKGFVLKYPHVDDLDDCDLGDNDRYKILIDLEGIKKEDRIYLDRPNSIWDEGNKEYYHHLILQPRN